MPQSPPHICILTTVHAPDDDRIFHKQALSLARAGYRVSLVGPWTPDHEPGPIIPVPLPAYASKTSRLLRAPWLAFRLALRQRADVYHFHDPELLPVGVLLALLGKRVVYDVHEDYSLKVTGRRLPDWLKPAARSLVRTFESFCARFFDRMLAADSHIASLFPSARTTVIGNYPPLEFVDPPSAPRPDHDPFRIVYVGGITEPRGIPRILDALAQLNDPGIEFHLAGNIPNPALRRRLAAHPGVVYHGVLPWLEVRDLLARCDVGMLVLQPVPALSFCRGEGIIKLWEYLGLGLPVIISATPALEALIDKLDAGLPVDPTDPAAIARAIRRLHEDPALRRGLGAHGRQAVLDGRNWDAEARKLLEVYRLLV